MALNSEEIRIALELSDPDFIPGFIFDGKYYTVSQVGVLPDGTSWFYVDPADSNVIHDWKKIARNLLPQRTGKKKLKIF